jgi:hypothetical protein
MSTDNPGRCQSFPARSRGCFVGGCGRGWVKRVAAESMPLCWWHRLRLLPTIWRTERRLRNAR